MSHTGFGTFSTEEVEIAKGYHYRNDNEQFILTPHFHPNSMVYAGGMYSTAADLAKFTGAHFGNSNNYLSDRSKRMMQKLGIGWLRNYLYNLGT